jgi:hypothetical protein
MFPPDGAEGARSKGEVDEGDSGAGHRHRSKKVTPYIEVAAGRFAPSFRRSDESFTYSTLAGADVDMPTSRIAQ